MSSIIYLFGCLGSDVADWLVFGLGHEAFVLPFSPSLDASWVLSGDFVVFINSSPLYHFMKVVIKLRHKRKNIILLSNDNLY